MKDCIICEMMEDSGLFSDKEIKDYHDSKLQISDFDARQQSEMYNIFNYADDETEEPFTPEYPGRDAENPYEW